MNSDEPKKRRGRPANEPTGKRHNVTVAMADPVRRAIGEAAEKNGRSLSSEIDFRLGVSLALEEDAGSAATRRLVDFARLAAMSIRNEMGVDWDEDHEAAAAMIGALDAFIVAASPEPPEAERVRQLHESGMKILDRMDDLRDRAMKGEDVEAEFNPVKDKLMAQQLQDMRIKVRQEKRRLRGAALVRNLIALMSGAEGHDNPASALDDRG